eukprot:620398-Amphidinium_carterae.1
MEHDTSMLTLTETLSDVEEHPVVRHEAAIALGAVGSSTARAAVARFCSDPDVMVSESCEVALDIMNYWEAWEALEARIASSA